MQAVSVAQKQQGYHPDGSFSAGLTQALQTVDFAIGNILTALAHSGLQVTTYADLYACADCHQIRDTLGNRM